MSFKVRLLTILVKYYLRRHGDVCEDDDFPEVALMEACVAAVSADKARGWYEHSGYL